MTSVFAPLPWRFTVNDFNSQRAFRILIEDAHGTALLESQVWERRYRDAATEMAKLVVGSADLLRACLMVHSLAKAGRVPSDADMLELRQAIVRAGGIL